MSAATRLLEAHAHRVRDALEACARRRRTRATEFAALLSDDPGAIARLCVGTPPGGVVVYAGTLVETARMAVVAFGPTPIALLEPAPHADLGVATVIVFTGGAAEVLGLLCRPRAPTLRLVRGGRS